MNIICKKLYVVGVASLIFLSFVHTISTSAQGSGDNTPISISRPSTGQSPLTALSVSIWASSRIDVCWENPTRDNEDGRRWVRQAVSQTWERFSEIRFIGWNACSHDSKGIRIQINDAGPHTQGLGSRLNGVSNGMVLNFTFNNFRCTQTREFCIRAIAVHEFGHALGFSHEQNRDDAPAKCRERQQGTSGDLYITPYDLRSIMNYCNLRWSGDGQLSETDIEGLRRTYNTYRFALQTRSALYETGKNFAFSALLNGDLMAIKKSATGSKTTEVHILDARSNYSRFRLQTATALHETGDNFAFSALPNGDLMAIKKSATGSKTTEVHILDARSNYSRFRLQTATALHETGDNFAFSALPDGNLMAIAKSSTGTHSTEVHILSAASNYSQFMMQFGSALHETDHSFDFVTRGYQLVALKKTNTGSKTTEIHILSKQR